MMPSACPPSPGAAPRMETAVEEGVPPEDLVIPRSRSGSSSWLSSSAAEQPEPEPEPEPAEGGAAGAGAGAGGAGAAACGSVVRSGWMRCETGNARSGRWSLLWLTLSARELVISDGAEVLARLPSGGLKARATRRSRKDAPFSFRLDVNETLVGRSQTKYVLEPHPSSEESKRQWITELNAASEAPPPAWRRGCELLASAHADKVARIEDATVLRSGYLWKQGPKRGDGFLRRWFVLARLAEVPHVAFLLYYSDATARKPKRIIPLCRDGFSSSAVDTHSHTWGGRQTYGFRLQLNPEVVAAGVALREAYGFATEHTASRAAWVAALGSSSVLDALGAEAEAPATTAATPATGGHATEDHPELRATAALSRGLPSTSSWVLIGEHDSQPAADDATVSIPVSWPQLEGRIQGLPAMYRVQCPCAVLDPLTATSVAMNVGDLVDVFEARKPTGSNMTVRTPLGWACVSDEADKTLLEPVVDASAALRRVIVTVHRAHSLPGMDLSGFSDPYCHLRLGTEEYKTAVISSTNNPVWSDESVAFTCPVDPAARRAAHREKVYLAVWDNDWGEDDFLGSVEIDLGLLCSSELYRPPLSKEDRLDKAVTEAGVTLPPWFHRKMWLPLRGVDRGFLCVSVDVYSLEVHGSDEAYGWPAKWFSAGMVELSHDEAKSAHERLDDQLSTDTSADGEMGALDEFGYTSNASNMKQWQESQEFQLALEELALLRWSSWLRHSDTRVEDTNVFAGVTRPDEDVATATDALRGLCSGRLRQLLLSGLPTERACARHPALVSWLSSIPMTGLRKYLWLHLSHGAEARATSKLSYDDIVAATLPEATVADWLALGQSAQAFEAGRALRPDIERDIPRTSEDIQPFEAEALTRILVGFALQYPHVGYTQGMGFIALMLLRVLSDEEAAFWTLCGVCIDICPFYYVPSMTGTQASMRCLQKLLSADLPRLASHFQAVGYSLDMACATWLVPLFSNTLPACVVVRVFDWLFVDGPDVLLFLVLALLRMLESRLLQCSDFGECHELLQSPQLSIAGGCMGRSMFRLLSNALDAHADLGSRVARWRVEATHAVVTETEERNAAAAVRALAAEGISEEDVASMHEKFVRLGIESKSGQHADEGLKVGAAGKAMAPVVYEARRLDHAGFRVVISELLPQMTAQMSSESLEALFAGFDWSGDGEISMSEMLMTVAVLRAGSTDARLQFCFQLCDSNRDGRVSAEELTTLFKLCYKLFYSTLPREHLPQIVEALLTSIEGYDPELGLGFTEFCAIATAHPFILDCLSSTALDEHQLKQQQAAAFSQLGAASGDARAIQKEGWVEITRSQAESEWERRWITVQDSQLVFHAAGSAGSPRRRHALSRGGSNGRTDASIEESHSISSLSVREPTHARLYHPHSLRLTMKDAGHTHKTVMDCGSFEQKLEWSMCLQTHGATISAALHEAAEVLQMQRQERAAAMHAQQLDQANADPATMDDTYTAGEVVSSGGGDGGMPDDGARRLRRLRTSLFFRSGALQLLSQRRWLNAWAVLSHGLLIIYDSEAGSGAGGTEHELRRLHLGDQCRSITFAASGGGETLSSDLISIVMGDDEDDVVRLSTGPEASGGEWHSSLRAQAHQLDEETEDKDADDDGEVVGAAE